MFTARFFAIAASLMASTVLSAGLMLATPQVTHAQPMRAADPAPVGQTVHFTLDKDEQKDLATTLPPGQYFVTIDVKRADDEPRDLFVEIDLLKTNGALIESNVVQMRVGSPGRIGGKFTVEKPYTAAKPLAARLRVKGQGTAEEYWITVQPIAKRTFIPFGFKNGDLKPMAIGSENGKGGTLDNFEWAFHKITLQPGKYNVSLYLKQANGKGGTLYGSLTMLDQYGIVSDKPSLDFYIQKPDLESRMEVKLLLLKPQTFIFRVDNGGGAKEYTVGIEKDTD